jgi:FkbM family methyltransferase
MIKRFNSAIEHVLSKLKSARVFRNWLTLQSAQRKIDDGETILETRCGLRIAIRHNKWDAEIIREQFIDREYLAGFRVPEGRPAVVVDVGSYIGDFALYCAHTLGANVVAYEPTKENFAMLEKNLGLNPHLVGRVKAINRGVASTPEINANVQVIGREIHVSSLWYANESTTEKRTFGCDTLKELLDKNKLDRVDLLKIDCEGGEYDIIPSTPKDVYDRIDAIVYEWHKTPEWEPKLDALEQRLRTVGFQVSRVGHLGYASRP